MFGLLIILLISSLPVIAVYVWFRLAKYQFSVYRFLFILLTGAAAFFPALLLQELLNFSFTDNRTALFFHHLIRIASTEEISRLLMLLIFFRISARYIISSPEQSISLEPLSFSVIKKATATGLVAGLGFALLENAVYAASDIRMLPLRVILTAAVHGACGSRIGVAAVLLRTNPIQAIMRVLTAIAIHGIYNMMITMSGFSPVAAILIAITALITAILAIQGGWSDGAAEDSKTVPENKFLASESQPLPADMPQSIPPSAENTLPESL